MNIFSSLPKSNSTLNELEIQYYIYTQPYNFKLYQSVRLEPNYNRTCYTIPFPINNRDWTNSNFKFLSSDEIYNSYNIVHCSEDTIYALFDGVNIDKEYRYSLYFYRR